MYKIEFPVPLLSKEDNWAWYIPPNVRADKAAESEEEEAPVLWVVFGGNNNEKYEYFSCVSPAKSDIVYLNMRVADGKISALLETRSPVVISHFFTNVAVAPQATPCLHWTGSHSLLNISHIR